MDSRSVPCSPHASKLGSGTTEAFVGDYAAHWARVDSGGTALTFVDYSSDRQGTEHSLDFGRVERWTRAIAARLQAVARCGDRVAILAPQGPEYYAAFIAVLRTDAIGVPLYPPDLPGHGERLVHVLRDCAPTVVLTTSAKRTMVEELCRRDAGLDHPTVLCIDEIDDEDDQSYVRPSGLMLDHPAYLQYTSGSTRIPAGVVITHRNLVSNVLQLANGNGLQFSNTTCVSWLPLFHDMGLLLGVAGPIIGGAHSVLLDPVAFVMRPARWLKALSGRRNVITAAPNFAYDYVVSRTKPADHDGLDLSGVVAWINGAEPVLASTLRRFHDAFATHGVHADALRPAYGLAEATVFVAVTPPGEEPTTLVVDAGALQRNLVAPTTGGRPGTHLVSSGRPVDQHLAIADPDTRKRLNDGQVGEIWIHGPNVGQSYWQKPDVTATLFGATIEGAEGLPRHGWLRTQDLGVVVDGRVYVTGRIKDLMIVDGRNLYPHDIELTVEGSDRAFAKRRLASFSVPAEAGEAIVVVAERYHAIDLDSRRREAMVAAARRAVSLEHAVALHDVIVVEPGAVARTSSGKIARGATRDAYLAGTLGHASGLAN